MRVVLIPSCILFLGMVTAIGVTLLAARSRIGSETQSGVGMGTLLISYALEKVAVARMPDEILLRLRHELAQVRHIHVHYAQNHRKRRWNISIMHPQAPALPIGFSASSIRRRSVERHSPW